MNIRILLIVGGAMSALYLGGVLLLRQPNNLGSTIELIQSGSFDEVGRIIAWLLSLLAFLWLAVGYLLQSRELHAQGKELQSARTELERMRGATEAQTALITLIERQTEIEELRVRPYFVVKSIGGSPQTKAVSIENTAATAYEVVVKLDGDVIQTEGHVGHGQRFSVSAKAGVEDELVLEVCFKDAGERDWSQTLKWDGGRATSNQPIRQKITDVAATHQNLEQPASPPEQ